MKSDKTSALGRLLAAAGISSGNGCQGYTQQIQSQVETLRSLVRKSCAKRVLEIGFNAGHSADIFLSELPDCSLVSFDLGKERAVSIGKSYIDSTYPGRHTLITGDSAVSVPAFASAHNCSPFDFIFIDGGHSYETASADLLNCAKLASKATVVAMDDTVFVSRHTKSYTVGPTRAWLEAVASGLVTESGRERYSMSRGMAWGSYL